MWDHEGRHEWVTGDGDIVLLRGAGWPTADARCLLHEATALDDERWTLTYRHNSGGPDGDYFA